MDAVTILRELSRRRIAVGVAAVVAVLVGLMLTYSVSLPPESRKHEVSIATGRILVDTPDSQVVDISPRGSENLGSRANLLANLMTEGRVKAVIARDAGLRPEELLAGAESAGELPELLDSARSRPQAHLLIARPVTDNFGEPLPIIEIEAQAPNAAGAAQLASAAATGLDAYLDSRAAVEDVSDARRLEVTGLGAPQVRQEIRGTPGLIALGAAVFVFVCGCVGILIAPGLARDWRASSE